MFFVLQCTVDKSLRAVALKLLEHVKIITNNYNGYLMDSFSSYKWNINNKVNEKNAYLDFLTRPRLF